MRIATLQFNPSLGKTDLNISRASTLLDKAHQNGELEDLDLLVLPEMALTGYNFPSKTAVHDFCEPTTTGVSTSFAKVTAKKHECIVCVGYPEYTEQLIEGRSVREKLYNSLVMVNRDGALIANYRKTFLYYTDETWAEEGGGFWAGELAFGHMHHDTAATTAVENAVLRRTSTPEPTKTAAGICMDINSYRFQAESTEYPFAEHVLASKAKLVILSMAWLSNLPVEELRGEPEEPDLNTVGYWLHRLRPLTEGRKGDLETETEEDGNGGELIVVFANRSGEEGEARYAGSSAVMGISNKGIRCWQLLGRGEEKLCIVDTGQRAKWRLRSMEKEESSI